MSDEELARNVMVDDNNATLGQNYSEILVSSLSICIK